MSAKTTKKPSPVRPLDPKLRAADTALRRAVRKVRERARRTGSPIVVYRDGRVIYERVTATGAAWTDFPDAEELRKTQGKDLPREPL